MLKVSIPTNVIAEPYMDKMIISDVVDPIEFFKAEENAEFIEIVDDPNFGGNFLKFIYVLEDYFDEDTLYEIFENINEKVTLDSMVSSEVVIKDNVIYLECSWDIDLASAISEAVKEDLNNIED